MEIWTVGIIIGIAVMLMHRLDRLGKQLEAVNAMIRADVARTKEDRDEVLEEWKENKKQTVKDERLPGHSSPHTIRSFPLHHVGDRLDAASGVFRQAGA